jgi:hypothetical protein
LPSKPFLNAHHVFWKKINQEMNIGFKKMFNGMNFFGSLFCLTRQNLPALTNITQ